VRSRWSSTARACSAPRCRSQIAHSKSQRVGPNRVRRPRWIPRCCAVAHRTRSSRLPARDRTPCRCCIPEKRQRSADCSYPGDWASDVDRRHGPRAAAFCGARVDPSSAGPRVAGLRASRCGSRAGRDALCEEQSRCDIRRPRRVMSELLLDAAGRCRSPATLPGPRRPAGAQRGRNRSVSGSQRHVRSAVVARGRRDRTSGRQRRTHRERVR
jgi:hypothetical protein